LLNDDIAGIETQPKSGTIDYVPENQQHAVAVAVEANLRLGPLSYLHNKKLEPGTAVQVPINQRICTGTVVGTGDPSKATKEVQEVKGRKFTEVEMRIAEHLAERYATDISTVLHRIPSKYYVSRGKNSRPTKSKVAIVPPVQDIVTASVIYAREYRKYGQLLILVPTAATAKKIAHELGKGADTASKDSADKFRAGTLNVLIATRSYCMSLGQGNVNFLVVEEEHPGHEDIKSPHWHARDVAILRAKETESGIVLLTHNPTALALASGLPITVDTSMDKLPNIYVCDTRKSDPAQRIPEEVQRAVHSTRNTNPIFVAVTREAQLLCGWCSTRWNCSELCEPDKCKHRASGACTICGYDQILAVGIGKSYVKSTLGPKAKLVVGSELYATKAVPGSTIVLVDIDYTLGAVDLDPDHRAISRILAAQKVVGSSGRVIIMSANPGSPIIQAIQKHDLLELGRHTWRNAKKNNLPPFSTMIKIESTADTLPEMKDWPGTIFGPSSTPTGWELLVRLNSSTDQHAMRPHLLELRRSRTPATIQIL
jgi:primosomal protein N'